MLVIAIGCRMMKDDAIGVLVAEHIQKKLNDNGIHVVIAETDFAFGIFALENDDHVIVLDAFCSGKKPGESTVLSLQEIENEETMQVSQHEHSLLDFIKQPAAEVHGYMIGIEAADIYYGLELSVQLKMLFNNICSSVEQIILNDLYNGRGL